MKLMYLGILKNEQKPAVALMEEFDLSSYGYFTRESVRQLMQFFAKTVAERTKPGQRNTVRQAKEGAQLTSTSTKSTDDVAFQIFCYARDGIAAVLISEGLYAQRTSDGKAEQTGRAGQAVLSKVIDEFLTKNPHGSWEPPINPPNLKEYLHKYQDPNNADSITKIQQELDETKATLHATIESVLERGEKIDNLVAKSDGLSTQSKMFYTQAKKQNSCCVVM